MERELKIKIGVVKRTTNDITSYQKEVVEEQGKLDRYKDDEFKLKQQKESIAESEMMVRDSKKRLAVALKDLQTKIQDNVVAQQDAEVVAVIDAAKKALE
ncbi:tubulin-specific chaperone A [Carpediemonas membranifera]|uniref:Tubulin-specific chaperone A n=1 Tax=Carpediemonas membranifera TaxID=201153 RepID=A0A8J6AUV0_9EUKA|nr:tubulin-specific chaperone A [Carpediemonas membranifera]|eukprot:KAG9394753.1 tubulin-specific chaperone A [Carpediemonas membranifera]